METAAVGAELPEYYREARMSYLILPCWMARAKELIEMHKADLNEAMTKIKTETNPEVLREYERRLGLLPMKIERMETRMRELSSLEDRKIAKLALFSIGSDKGEVLDYFEIKTPGIFMQYGVMHEALAMYGG